jgi:hypothetical protein
VYTVGYVYYDSAGVYDNTVIDTKKSKNYDVCNNPGCNSHTPTTILKGAHEDIFTFVDLTEGLGRILYGNDDAD